MPSVIRGGGYGGRYEQSRRMFSLLHDGKLYAIIQIDGVLSSDSFFFRGEGEWEMSDELLASLIEYLRRSPWMPYWNVSQYVPGILSVGAVAECSFDEADAAIKTALQ